MAATCPAPSSSSSSAGSTSPAGPATPLAERVLEASAPGRGTPDLELVGAAEESAFGPRPIEPLDLPDSELIRVATGLIAEDLVADGAPPAPAPGTLRPWRRRYRLVGDPWLADPVRAELIHRGRPPGGRGATVYVLGTDLATMLDHAWTIRSFSDGGPPWPEWLGRFAGRPRVPPRVDLLAAAHTWEQRVGRDRVEIVLEPALLPRLLGVRRAAGASGVLRRRRRPGPAGRCGPGPAGAPGRCAPSCSWRASARAWPTHPDSPLGVPDAHAEWVRRRAVRMRDALLSAGYAVHGDPDALVPPAAAPALAAGSEPDDARVLALALRLLLEEGVR